MKLFRLCVSLQQSLSKGNEGIYSKRLHNFTNFNWLQTSFLPVLGLVGLGTTIGTIHDISLSLAAGQLAATSIGENCRGTTE